MTSVKSFSACSVAKLIRNYRFFISRDLHEEICDVGSKTVDVGPYSGLLMLLGGHARVASGCDVVFDVLCSITAQLLGDFERSAVLLCEV
jgi:hypothetical protein